MVGSSVGVKLELADGYNVGTGVRCQSISPSSTTTNDGSIVGCLEGRSVGSKVDTGVGTIVGGRVGVLDGSIVGTPVTFNVGSNVGTGVGRSEGSSVGVTVASL